ncbi:MAG: ABC transporter permease [Mycoplasmoidaceae bacterium]
MNHSNNKNKINAKKSYFVQKNKKQLLNMIWRMAIIDIYKQYKGSIFAWIWLFGAPLLFVGTYIFGLTIGGSFKTEGIKIGRNTYDETSWLIIGSFAWTYMGSAITKSCNSIREYSWIITGIGAPIYTIPIFTNLSKVVIGAFSMIISVLLYIVIYELKIIESPKDHHGPLFTVRFLYFPLTIFSSFLFLSLLSLAIAPISAISKDVTNIIILIPAILAWLSAVTIPPKDNFYNNKSVINIIMIINPFFHLIDQFRQSVLGYGGGTYWWIGEISFWLVMIGLLVISIFITTKMAKHIADIV